MVNRRQKGKKIISNIIVTINVNEINWHVEWQTESDSITNKI